MQKSSLNTYTQWSRFNRQNVSLCWSSDSKCCWSQAVISNRSGELQPTIETVRQSINHYMSLATAVCTISLSCLLRRFQLDTKSAVVFFSFFFACQKGQVTPAQVSCIKATKGENILYVAVDGCCSCFWLSISKGAPGVVHLSAQIRFFLSFFSLFLFLSKCLGFTLQNQSTATDSWHGVL